MKDWTQVATQALDSFAPSGKQAPARRLPVLAAVPVTAAPRGPRFSPKIWAAILVVALHAAALAALLSYHYIVQTAKPPEALVLLDIAASRPPERAAPPEIPDIPPAVIPPPVIEIENRPPTITAAVVETPPPAPAPYAPAAKGDAPSAPPAPAAPAPFVADLSASMIEAVPPRYPLESRRLKEQGTVVLDLLLDVDGRVEQISVRSSSGFSRLDQAALHAVRKWRWSPTLRNGSAVPVRGLVEIPFALAPHG